VLAYTGHPGGAGEAEAVHDLLATLSTPYEFREEQFPAGRSAPPRLFLVEHRAG
jgi:hypothetical protein